MQGHAGVLRERLEPLAEQFGVHVPDLGGRKVGLGPVGAAVDGARLAGIVQGRQDLRGLRPERAPVGEGGDLPLEISGERGFPAS